MFILSTVAALCLIPTPQIIPNAENSPILEHVTINKEFRNDVPHVYIEAMVQIGGNGCFAKGVQADFDTLIENETLYLFARTTGGDAEVCPHFYAPVFQQINFETQVEQTTFKEIVLVNVDREGRNLPIINSIRCGG